LSTNDYHFVSRWRVQGNTREVYDILADATALPTWWPSLYRHVAELQPGGPDQVGKVINLEARGGWLPYTLRWFFAVTDSDPPHGFGLRAWGDFDGTGRWTLAQDGAWVDVTYDWRIKAEKPLLKHTSALLRPLFAVNHGWAMKRGEDSLRLEVLRRRTQGNGQRLAIPPPPGPAPIATLPAPLLLAAGLLTVAFMFRRWRGRVTPPV
jgi:hypothetical protein